MLASRLRLYWGCEDSLSLNSMLASHLRLLFGGCVAQTERLSQARAAKRSTPVLCRLCLQAHLPNIADSEALNEVCDALHSKADTPALSLQPVPV
jgi:hypothetical protein